MKTWFGKQLMEYEKPLVRPVAPVEKELNLDVDIPTEFIQIPDSKYQVSVGYLNVDDEPLVNKNYTEFYDLLKQINQQTGNKYRFPILSELIRTYRKAEDQEFNNSFENYAEWTADVIKDGKELIRNPADVRYIDDKLKVEGNGILVKLAEDSGYVKKWNEQALPEKVISNKPSNNPVWWSGTRDGFRPVFRGWGAGGGCVDAGAHWDASDSDSSLSARLVKLAQK